MEWLGGESSVAMGIILSAAGVHGNDGFAILRAKRELEDLANAHSRWEERQTFVKLRALLELLVSKDARAMLAIFDSCLPAGERMTVASLVLLYQHSFVLKNPIQMSLLRERAEEALELYPGNSIIVGVFLEVERGQALWGRVRQRIFGDSQHTSVYRLLEQVWVANWEKTRWLAEAERTRGILRAAIDHER
jgi:hypothetical protein